MAPEAKEKMAAKKRGMPSWHKGMPYHQWVPTESNERRKLKISQNHARYWLGKERPDLRQNPSFMESVTRNLNRLRQDMGVENKRLNALRRAREKPEYRLKQAEATRLSWKDQEVREKRIKGALKALNRRPTNLEQRLIGIIKKYKLPYRYTGDGSVIVAGLNPDFINANGAKTLIEIFGIAFHDPERTFRSRIPLPQQEEYRKAIYASFGFDCLVLWDDEMEGLSDKEIANRIKKFTKSRKLQCQAC